VPESAPKVAVVEPAVRPVAPTIVPPATEPDFAEWSTMELNLAQYSSKFSLEQKEVIVQELKSREQAAAAIAAKPAIVEQPKPVLVAAPRKPGRRPGGLKVLVIEMLQDLAHRVEIDDLAEVPKRLRKINKFLRNGFQQPSRKKYKLKSQLYLHRKVHANRILQVPSRMRRPRKPKPAAELSST
jgi:hypothetical protein